MDIDKVMSKLALRFFNHAKRKKALQQRATSVEKSRERSPAQMEEFDPVADVKG